jgi:CheY-like chemotaxis protein/anti-sigma regulatory factor (Ser/Thr protein kinase)
MLAPQAKEKEVALDSCVGDDLPPVVSDPDKVRHILQNLIGNAVKFTEAGSVEVTALKAGEAFQVSVRDTGIGIAADQLPSIFEEFRQVDSSSSRKYGGTGLGLAIAKKYATLLQGDIVVESTPGRGSTFTLRLPLALSHAEHEPDSALPAGVAPAGSKNSGGQERRILLVEDSEPAIIQVTDILTRNGWQVDVARNGREALAKVEAFPPDALILDLMMPEMDGFEVLRQIRGKERSIFLPVLILTAKHVTREELSFLKGNHIHQLIQKGDIGGNELLAAVERMVRPQPDGAVTLAGGRRSRGRSGKPVVLVVEDNPDNLRAARALLEQTCELFEATDGRAGVEQARRHRPDLIQMDLSMPVMDGFAALVELRADEALCDIPVVAVTASAMKGDREEILAHGFDGYLSKPIDAELLHKVMREVLHGTQ